MTDVMPAAATALHVGDPDVCEALVAFPLFAEPSRRR